MAKVKKADEMAIEWTSGGSYAVRFADDAFGEGAQALASLLKEITGSDEPRMMLVADSNVVQRSAGLGMKIGKFVQTTGVRLAGAPVVIAGGEKLKSDFHQSLQKMLTAAVEARVGAKDAMVVIGGGTVTDVASYVAVQTRGGLPIVRIPTTVAAMVDGAFAECASLNLAGVKDAIRIPCRPAGVVIDTTFATTVLDGVWRGGLGEMIRYAATKDAALFKRLVKSVAALKDRNAGLLSEFVRATVESRVKKGGSDVGLWCASRLETMSSYKLPHGYATPIAMCIDCAYAVERGLMTEDDQELVCRTLAESGALDGLSHSLYLLDQPDSILRGLDAWRLTTGGEAITIPAGIGKTVVEEHPDRAVFDKVVKCFRAASRESEERSDED